MGYSPRSHKESDTAEHTRMAESLCCTAEINTTLIQLYLNEYGRKGDRKWERKEGRKEANSRAGENLLEKETCSKENHRVLDGALHTCQLLQVKY